VKVVKPDDLAVADLVRHLLYPTDEWLALVLEIDGDPDPLTRKSRVLVHMLPGIKYEQYFRFKYRRDERYPTDCAGWISINWLRKASLDILGNIM